MKRKAFVAFSVLVLATGLVAAAVIYESNRLSGTFDVPPAGLSLSLVGSIPSSFVLNWTTDIGYFNIMDTVPKPLNITVYLNVSSPGITPANVTVHNGTLCIYPRAVMHILIPCQLERGPVVNATQVTPDEISFPIPVGVWTGTAEFGTGELYVTVHNPGTHSWTAQVFGVPE